MERAVALGVCGLVRSGWEDGGRGGQGEGGRTQPSTAIRILWVEAVGNV